MEYLHLIPNETKRDLVRRVAQNDPTLKALTEIDDIDADLSLALGHALIGNTCLRELHLVDLILTEEAAHALAQGMTQSKIEILELLGSLGQQQQQQQAPQDDESASPLQGHRICDIFYRGIQASRSIQKLYLWQSSLIGDPGNAWHDTLLGVTLIRMFLVPRLRGYVQAFSNVLSRATLLKELVIVLTDVAESVDMTIVARGLCQNTSITTLLLVNSENIHHQHEQFLFAQGLSPNSAITILAATKFCIDDGCIELMINGWLPNCQMEELYLCFNEIGPTGAQKLVQALAAYPTMLKLFLHNNTSIGYKGLQLIGNELPNLQHLTYLCLDCCSIWKEDLKAESEEAEAQTKARQQAGQALLDGIKHNFFITELEVINNHFPSDMVDEIDFYCTLNKMGRYLLAANDDHGVALSVWCHVFVKCQDQANFDASLVYFYLKELPTLVHSRPLLKRKRS